MREHLEENIPFIEKKIGYTFSDKKLLFLAFTHRSFINEHRSEVKEHNERLEFLGDAVLELLISDFLYLHFPQLPEGELSYLRSRLVEASSCASFLSKLGLEEYLLMGKGEAKNEGRGRNSLLANLFEALIGAIYLDGGVGWAHKFLFSHFEKEIISTIKTPYRNWKAELQDHCQKKYQIPPEYIVKKELGPDHDKRFVISVLIQGEEMGNGEGPSKKEAEQISAEQAITTLGL